MQQQRATRSDVGANATGRTGQGRAGQLAGAGAGYVPDVCKPWQGRGGLRMCLSIWLNEAIGAELAELAELA